MKTKAYALVSTIAFAMSSPVFAAAVTDGAGAANTTEALGPRYGLTKITNEKVTVTTNPKTIHFAVHSKTADSSPWFVVNFSSIAGETATVKASAFDASGNIASGYSNVTCTSNCTFPQYTRKATITISSPNNSTNSKTYSTEYYQDCDSSATRFCGTKRTYASFNGTFVNNSTETEVGNSGTYQGDFDIFNSNNGNTPAAGDLVSLKLTSSRAVIAGNTPTLRIKATVPGTNNEVQIGHRYPCTIIGSDRKRWDCKIGVDANGNIDGDAVPNLASYTNPRIVFSSTRNGVNGTITVDANATKHSFTP